MAKWYFRRIGFKLRGFNNLCYTNEFIRITNEFLNNKKLKYNEEILKCLKNNKEYEVSSSNYSKKIEECTYRSTNATYLLAFLETCMNNDNLTVPLEGMTLEHIYCQKDKDKLKNLALMNNIGNLTLIEGKNSSNGHKGNSSLGSKPYDKKIKSYRDSSYKVTRDIACDFNNSFDEDQINERCKKLAKLLDTYTDY